MWIKLVNDEGIVVHVIIVFYRQLFADPRSGYWYPRVLRASIYHRPGLYPGEEEQEEQTTERGRRLVRQYFLLYDW